MKNKGALLLLSISLIAGTHAWPLALPYDAAVSATKYFKRANPTPNFPALIRQWSQMKNPSIERALSFLPATMRENYLLMHNSGSIQGSSYVNPRAILFTPATDLVVSFNGSADQVNGNSIEAMSYNSASEMYDFYEVSFEGGRVHADKNPVRCNGCHTDSRLPNWQPYNDWAGAYGSRANKFGSVSVVPPGAKYVYYNEDNNLAALEFKKFTEFIATQKQQPRYSVLIQPARERYWPFTPTLPAVSPIDAYDYEPLRRFGIGLTFHQARSISPRLLKSALYRDYPASLISSLLGCAVDNWAAFRAKLLAQNAVQPLFTSNDAILQTVKLNTDGWTNPDLLPQLIAVSGVTPETWATNLYERSNALANFTFETSNVGFYDMNNVKTVTAVLLLEDFKKSHRDFEVVKDGPTLSLSAGMGAPIELLVELDRLSPLYSQEKIEKVVCPALIPAIQQETAQAKPIMNELSTMQMAEVHATQAGVPYVLKRCTECHANQTYPGAPYIPFNNPFALKAALNDSGGYLMDEILDRTRPDQDPRIRMPKGPVGIAPQALIEYLQGIKNGR